MTKFQVGSGNWIEYRNLPGLVEVDYHYGPGSREVPYWEAMDAIYADAFEKLKDAHTAGAQYVLYRHGSSTSDGWKHTTARSQVRRLMRSKEATPYIDRHRSIQHYSVFVAAIRK